MALADTTPARAVAALEAGATRAYSDYPGGQVAWRIWGAGAPLVLLHGGSGSWTHWLRNIPALAARYRVIVPDLPGFGDSGAVPEPLAVEGFGEALAAGLPALVPDEAATLVGFSFGALVGGAVALRLGRKVAAQVLVGAVGMGLRRNPFELAKWRHLADETARLEAHRTNLARLMIHEPAAIDDLALHLQDRNTARTRLNTRQIARGASLADMLAAAEAPLAGIWGAHDATATPYVDERRELLQRLQPGAPFVLIENAGHWVQYEAAEEFNAALVRVLDSLRPAGRLNTIETMRGRAAQP